MTFPATPSRPLGALALVLGAALAGCGEEPAPASLPAAPAPRPGLLGQVEALRDALERSGGPLATEVSRALTTAAARPDGAAAARALRTALDPLCLFVYRLRRDGAPVLARGPAAPALVQHGWRRFLIAVHNETGARDAVGFACPQALPLYGAPAPRTAARWLDLRVVGHRRGFRPSGAPLEYLALELYSRDAGAKTGEFGFPRRTKTGQVTASNRVQVDFDCAAAHAVVLRVRDADGAALGAAFTIRDAGNRLLPPQAKRLAPDLSFQTQVYRADGDRLALPPGRYSIACTRGPEWIAQNRQVEITPATETLEFRLERWIDPSAFGYWSGDTHIHAAGCAHYDQPTPGILPADVLAQTLGEDLHVGCVLNWQPSFDFQKQFFTAGAHPVSRDRYLLRYDVEVSGFGSHRSGHLVLLGLDQQVPPGGASTEHWPTLCLSTLRWAKRQGAVTGFGHAGSGLAVDSTALPNYLPPPFDGVGACEFLIDVTHTAEGPSGAEVPAVDFLGVGDTPPYWDLNIWYHVLNCGYRPRIAGESDFPCLNNRVGAGRSYARLDGPLAIDAWLDAIRAGRSYTSDGRSHLLDLQVDGVGLGGEDVRLAQPGRVTLTARVAARLPAKPRTAMARRRARGEADKGDHSQGELGSWPFAPTKPYWHLEFARVGATREVPVEVVVNGEAVARRAVVADGALREVSFEIEITRSSWVALRIFPSSHTNPVFVAVGDAPIRASRRSAQWCLDGVDRCWQRKRPHIAAAEQPAATAAYEHARREYRRILAESPP